MPAGEQAADLAAHVAAAPLVDHHVHGAFRTAIGRPTFEQSINEGSPEPIPAWMTQFDSQLGFAIRAWCAPLLDLEPHVPAAEYWSRRAELGETEVTRRFLRAAGVIDWIVDTGHHGDDILSPAELAEVSGARSHEIVRVEVIAESLLRQPSAVADYPDAFRARLAEAARDAVGFKTVVAYRSGFDIDWTRPSEDQAHRAAQTWAGSADTDRGVRLVDPTLLCFGVHAALETGLPLQIHTGFGDRDLDLHRANPMLLLGLLRQPAAASIPIMLLHCYPYHREAGYLAQAFSNVYCDIGLALNYVGSRAVALLAESLEMAPFAKVLYSSDAFGPAELHYLGARLWRHAMATTIAGWIDAQEWSATDAVRIVDMIAAGNARRVYGLAR